MSRDTEALIRMRAYAIWESENRPHGRDREHWERAAREVAGEPAVPPVPPVKRTRKVVAKAAIAAPAKVAVAPAKAAPAAPVKLPSTAFKTPVKPKPKRV